MPRGLGQGFLNTASIGDLVTGSISGGTKKRKQRDIAAAQAMWEDYRRRRPKAR